MQNSSEISLKDVKRCYHNAFERQAYLEAEMAALQVAGGAVRATKIDFLILAVYVSTYFVKGSHSSCNQEKGRRFSGRFWLRYPDQLGLVLLVAGVVVYLGVCIKVRLFGQMRLECVIRVESLLRLEQSEALEMCHKVVQQCGPASCGPAWRKEFVRSCNLLLACCLCQICWTPKGDGNAYSCREGRRACSKDHWHSC